MTSILLKMVQVVILIENSCHFVSCSACNYIFSSDWDKSHVKSDNSRKPTQKMRTLVKSKSEIILKNGDYTNANYGNGKDNGIACRIQEKTDILIINYPGHTPIIRFDGTGGISMSEVCVPFFFNRYLGSSTSVLVFGSWLI